MARNFTVAQIIARAKQLADMENSTFIGDAEWMTMCSAAYTELYDILTRSGLAYNESPAAAIFDGSSNEANLPSDFYGALGAFWKLSDNRWVRLREISHAEAPIEESAHVSVPTHFRVVGNVWRVHPWPGAGTARLVYVPAPADLTSTGTSVNGVSGWEDLMIVQMAIRALAKEESSTTHLERERARLMERIEEAADNRSMTGGSRVIDTEGQFVVDGGFWPYHGGGW